MNAFAARDAAREIFFAGLRAADPAEAVEASLGSIKKALVDGGLTEIVFVAFGKAADPMARSLIRHMSGSIRRGIVLTKHGHLAPGQFGNAVDVYEGGHPLPDEGGRLATGAIEALVSGAGPEDLVVCLISGGGSALLVSPCEPITLTEKQQTTDLLLKAGCDIFELNTVRKHLSRVKGGRLAGLARGGKVVSLILSDVIGDRLDVIASGPTAPDGTTYGDALAVLATRGLTEVVPSGVLEVLTEGSRGQLPETPKPGDPLFKRVENVIVASNGIALAAAAARARALGLHVVVASSELSGEASSVGRDLAGRAMQLRAEKGEGGRPLCILAGGETTVTVRGRGLGGRNTELALAFAMEIAGTEGITLLSAGTDGTDGPTDAAGAVADGGTIAAGLCRGLDARDTLERNDSYSFFAGAGGLFVTGPTGTNVMDLQIIIVE